MIELKRRPPTVADWVCCNLPETLCVVALFDSFQYHAELIGRASARITAGKVDRFAAGLVLAIARRRRELVAALAWNS